MSIDYNDVKELGRTGEKLSAIGLGTYNIIDYGRALETFIHGIEKGINNIDTAEMYDYGAAEKFVGRVLKKVGKENVFVTTKLLPERFRDPRETLRAAEKSLERLSLSQVDLILIHWPDWIAPIETQVRNLEVLAEKGLTRYIGVSNFDEIQLEKAMEATRRFEIVADQVKYSIIDRWVENSLLPYCVEKGVTVQAYTPLERGEVSRIDLLKKIGEEKGKTPVQIALNYIISSPRTIAIVKTEKKEHLDEIIGSMGWRLDEKTIEFIRENL
jgi:diketogulonate reductase-like aldo/keto reductase